MTAPQREVPDFGRPREATSAAEEALPPVPGAAAMDLLMPMHLVVDPSGRILRVGPTLAKLFPGMSLFGQDFFSAFSVLRPRGIRNVADLLGAPGARLSIGIGSDPKQRLKALAVPLTMSEGALINMSFGISVVDAVRTHNLTAGDFAATDLAVEMLYLVEAKSAALQESKQLNLRLQQAKLAAEEQASTDTLSGLKNRRALTDVLRRLVEGRATFGLMQLDLDRFKQVNDLHGHATGDIVLQKVAEALLSVTRSMDTIARVGGDEFVLVIHGTADRDKLTQLAQRIIARIEQPIQVADAMHRISASIGLVSSDMYSQLEPDRLLRDADLALYASKRLGRGRFTVFTPQGGQNPNRLLK